MTPNKKPAFPADLIGLLIGALMLGGLLLYGATTQQPLPLLPALAVMAVNLFAAVRLLLNVRKRRAAQLQADKK